MKRFFLVCLFMLGIHATSVHAQDIPSNIYGKTLPYTWEVPMMNGKMICTMHENGYITSQMVTGCYLCGGYGACNVCKGTGGQYWYGIGIMPCGNCGGRGACPSCNGKGYCVMSSTTSPSGLTIATDERGNTYVASGGNNDIGGGSSGYTREKKTCGYCGGKGWVAETKGVPDFGAPNKWCDECDKTVPPNHYHAKCPSCNGNGKW